MKRKIQNKMNAQYEEMDGKLYKKVLMTQEEIEQEVERLKAEVEFLNNFLPQEEVEEESEEENTEEAY